MTGRDIDAIVRAACAAHPLPASLDDVEAATRRVIEAQAEAEGRTPAAVLAESVAAQADHADGPNPREIALAARRR